jgi:hypothetical protein
VLTATVEKLKVMWNHKKPIKSAVYKSGQMIIGFTMQVEQMACIHRGLNGRGFILVHEGYRYQRNKTHACKITWRWWRKDYRANIVTNLFDVKSHAPAIQVHQVGKSLFI